MFNEIFRLRSSVSGVVMAIAMTSAVSISSAAATPSAHEGARRGFKPSHSGASVVAAQTGPAAYHHFATPVSFNPGAYHHFP
jgi:hypothetical protein